MRTRRRASASGPLWLRAVAVSYSANCALGTAVATGALRTGRWHWIHHALYICTSTLTALAWATLRRSDTRAASALAPAAVPLAVIAFAGTHGRRHPAIALAAAPFVLAALGRTRRPARRRGVLQRLRAGSALR
ncbi:hypothetical protein C5D09_11235 [Rathayibacter sp. AY1C9]|uniref:hypothetical protein n=1 Tax=Rathayibacter sp. AY1C9 TaxID=2080541 RepID=UPI000CE86AAD|nr:hypothetical protein [Rathayibacter sp. AY1C9]PPH45255.1 hypothetical protein C5D09_11235 [Rathayibacter sp. AY1C9]